MKKILISTAVAVVLLTGCGEDKKSTTETEVINTEVKKTSEAQKIAESTVSSVTEATKDIASSATEAASNFTKTVTQAVSKVVEDTTSVVKETTTKAKTLKQH